MGRFLAIKRVPCNVVLTLEMTEGIRELQLLGLSPFEGSASRERNLTVCNLLFVIFLKDNLYSYFRFTVMWNSNYFVYITTNPDKSVLYVGMTNDLSRRMREHYENRGQSKTFAGRYFCYNLIFWERYDSPSDAISHEKEIKKWRREKKEILINSQNPGWKTMSTD